MQARESIINTVEVLCSVFNREPNEHLITAWSIVLNDLNDEEIARGLTRTLKERSNPFMPTPSEFCDLATLLPGCLTIEAEAELAFAELENSIGKAANQLYFKNPVIAEFVRKQGGWRTISMWTYDEIPFRRKDFVSMYGSLKRTKTKFLPWVETGMNYTGESAKFIGEWSAEEKTEALDQRTQEIENHAQLNKLLQSA